MTTATAPLSSPSGVRTPLDVKAAIGRVARGQDLLADEAAEVMGAILAGETTPAQIAAFATALGIKGETPDEIEGLARAMRAHATRIEAGPVVDTAGTGADGRGTFNISTAAAIVAAAAGARVAKHGNRAATSACGSADVLEALGVRLDLEPAGVARCLERTGIGFLFAPLFHPAMRHAASARREIGIRTVFNILGPLTNPAGARAQLLGVADAALAPRMALALHRLGAEHALIVYGEDGLDEISVTAPTRVHEVRPNGVRTYTIRPEDFGLPVATLVDLRGGTPTANADRIRAIFAGEAGPAADVVALNAGAALYVGGYVRSLANGLALARVAIADGRARAKLDELITNSQMTD